MKSELSNFLDDEVRFFDVLFAYSAAALAYAATFGLPFFILFLLTDIRFERLGPIGILIVAMYVCLFLFCLFAAILMTMRIVKIWRRQPKRLMTLLREEIARD